MSRLFTILMSAALLVCCSRPLCAQIDDSLLAPVEGILVLRNGNVLRGKITPIGDRYLVAVADRGEVLVPAQDVELKCRDLTEAYEQMQKEVRPGSLHERLDLVEWCLRHQLHSLAAKELVAALRIDPQHARCRNLEQRLLLAAERETAAETAPSSAAQSVTPKKIDDTLRELPPEAVEQFTSIVQPLLMNRCATGGCHGPSAANKLRLMHSPRGLPPAQRLTHRNLLAVLETVDRTSPAESPLLALSRAAHGELKTPAITEHESRLYEQLAAWVVTAVVKPQAPQPETVDTPPINLSQSGVSAPPPWSLSPSADPFGDAMQAGADLEAFLGDGADIELPHPSVVEGQRPAKLGPAARAAPQPPAGGGYAARDPFDPEIFNRRFLGDGR